MPHTHTHTILAISQAAFDEIHVSLSKAEYTHLFSRDSDGRLVIQMDGLALAPERKPKHTLTGDKSVEDVVDEPLAMVNPMVFKCDWYPVVPGTVRGRFGAVSTRTFNDGSGKGKLYCGRRIIGRVEYADGIFRFKEPVHVQVTVSFKFKP